MTTAPDEIWLQPGRPHTAWMPRGAHLLVQRGGVTLVAPSGDWLDPGQVMQTTLPAGCAHHVRHGGWVRLEAMGLRPAQVRCIGPKRTR